ncbi:hypothetical protein ACVWZ6_007682 [Bradyrhizobium sp. GM6.1]
MTTVNFPVSDAAMVRGSITLILLALGMPSLAAAETMSFGDAIGLLAKSCGAEIVANCRGVNPDSTRLKECLSRNRDVLSQQCQSDYLGAFDAIQKARRSPCHRGERLPARDRQGLRRLDQGDQQGGPLPGLDAQGHQQQLPEGR